MCVTPDVCAALTVSCAAVQRAVPPLPASGRAHDALLLQGLSERNGGIFVKAFDRGCALALELARVQVLFLPLLPCDD